jgi:hypothetical protein
MNAYSFWESILIFDWIYILCFIESFGFWVVDGNTWSWKFKWIQDREKNAKIDNLPLCFNFHQGMTHAKSMRRFGLLRQHWGSPKCLQNIGKLLVMDYCWIFTSQSHKRGKKRSLKFFFFFVALYVWSHDHWWSFLDQDPHLHCWRFCIHAYIAFIWMN